MERQQNITTQNEISNKQQDIINNKIENVKLS